MASKYAKHLDALLQEEDPAQAGMSRNLDPRLHRYQVQAVHHLWDHPRSMLWLEMGLGKTAISLQALTPEHLPALVVSTARAAEMTWTAEAATWRPDLKVVHAKGGPKARARASGDVVVVSRDSLANTKFETEFRTVVLDELSGYKSASASRTRAARKLANKARYVWGLTGTPIPNGYPDLWAPTSLIDQGVRLGRTLTVFRQRYLYPMYMARPHVVGKWGLKAGADSEIEQALSDITLAMQSTDYLDLPPVTYNYPTANLPTRKEYDSLLKDLVLDTPTLEIAAADQAGVLGKLQQLSAGFLYDQDNQAHWMHKAKMDLVKEIVEGTGGRVMVLYHFQAERDRLLKILPDSTCDPAKFEDHQVLVAHPASVGHGLNLQHLSASVVWSTLPWSSELYQQANARVNRQGQTKPVVIHHAMMVDTVDDKALAVVQGKISLQDALMQALGM